MTVRSTRKSALSVVFFLVSAAVLLAGISSAVLSRQSMSAAVLERGEARRVMHVAKDVEETFWRSAAISVESCPSCTEEEAQARLLANLALWQTFWAREEGADLQGTIPLAYVSFSDGSSGREFYVSVPAEIRASVGNLTRTYAIMKAGEERRCLLPQDGECDWNI